MFLSAILATKGRGEQAARCIDRFFETTKGFDVELILMAYPDEDNIRLFHRKQYNPVNVQFLENRLMECYNIGATLAQGTHLFDFDDDAYFTDDWMVELTKTVESVPDQYGYFKIQSDNVCYWAERAVGSRQFYIDHLGGVISIPAYYSQWNDVEKSDRAIIAGHFHESKAYIEHRTWVYGKAPIDEVYQNGSMKYAGIDGATYNARKAKGFPNDYEAVLK